MDFSDFKVAQLKEKPRKKGERLRGKEDPPVWRVSKVTSGYKWQSPASYLLRVSTAFAEVIRGFQDALLDIRCHRQHTERFVHVLPIVDSQSLQIDRHSKTQIMIAR